MRQHKTDFSTRLPLTMADLARRQAATVPRQAFPLLPEWLLAPDAPFAGLIDRYCTEATHKLALMEVWFKEATATVDDVPARNFIDKDETLVSAMEDLEETLLGLRAEMLDLASGLEKLKGPQIESIRDALRPYAQVNADLFEAVQAFKWAVMEHDYGADMVAGFVCDSFSIVEDLFARLKAG